jgi:hypothetical protein
MPDYRPVQKNAKQPQKPCTQRTGKARGLWRVSLTTFVGLAMGCGATRMTNTTRTATEQLLISNAVDQAVSQLDFRYLADKPVYLDIQYLDGAVDKGYLVSTLRQHLLASGCCLKEERKDATYVVEARSGGVGTDSYQLLVGIPQMQVPAVVPAQPTQIPEIPFAKKNDQQGIAKIAVFAYNRFTGRPVFQSGSVEALSSARDVWLLGAGPFRKGSIKEGTEFAGEPIIPGPEKVDDRPVAVAVTAPASWQEAPTPHVEWAALWKAVASTFNRSPQGTKGGTSKDAAQPAVAGTDAPATGRTQAQSKPAKEPSPKADPVAARTESASASAVLPGGL